MWKQLLHDPRLNTLAVKSVQLHSRQGRITLSVCASTGRASGGVPGLDEKVALCLMASWLAPRRAAGGGGGARDPTVPPVLLAGTVADPGRLDGGVGRGFVAVGEVKEEAPLVLLSNIIPCGCLEGGGGARRAIGRCTTVSGSKAA